MNNDIYKMLNYNEDKESDATFAIPNEIFPDLQSRLKFGQCAYAYSYYYLNMYLHLYAKYGTEQSIDKFTVPSIQEMLGISRDSRSMTSITKKGGLLDELGYTSTITDYPVERTRLEYVDGWMEVEHTMYSEVKDDYPDSMTHGRNFTVKHPDKMYWRTQEAKEEGYNNGTIFEPDNTHILPLKMFLKALSINEIGIKGFYIYGFIKYKHDKSRGRGWIISNELFQKDIGLSKKTLTRLIKSLKEHEFIKIERRKTDNNKDLPSKYTPIL